MAIHKLLLLLCQAYQVLQKVRNTLAYSEFTVIAVITAIKAIAAIKAVSH